jgi:hypothetical protein
MKRPEQQLQIAVAAFLGHALKKPTWWSAIGHGGGGRLRGIFLKAMGVQPGIADLLIIHPDEVQNFPWVIWIELKADKGTQSTPQKDFQRTMENLSPKCVYYVARSVDDVECFLRGLRIPLHARIAA